MVTCKTIVEILETQQKYLVEVQDTNKSEDVFITTLLVLSCRCSNYVREFDWWRRIISWLKIRQTPNILHNIH